MTYTDKSHRLTYEPLSLEHVDELGRLLLNEQVYRHIGGKPPAVDEYRRRVARVLSGPPDGRSDEVWLNHVARQSVGNLIVGRLEATVHDGIAEVAFLFGPDFWGKGYATEGLLWLHGLLLSRPDCHALWATTVPANLRSQALLQRCDYVQVMEEYPARLLSFDEGDLVFRGPGKT